MKPLCVLVLLGLAASSYQYSFRARQLSGVDSGSAGMSGVDSGSMGMSGVDSGSMGVSGDMGQSMSGADGSMSSGHGDHSDADEYGYFFGHFPVCTLTEGGYRDEVEEMKKSFERLADYAMTQMDHIRNIQSDTAPDQHWIQVGEHLSAVGKKTRETFDQSMEDLVMIFFRIRGHPSFRNELKCDGLKTLWEKHEENRDLLITPIELKEAIITDGVCLSEEIRQVFNGEHVQLPQEQLSEKQVAMINAMMLTKLSLLEEDIRVFSHSLQKLGERVQEQGSVMISQDSISMNTRAIVQQLLSALHKRKTARN